MAKIWTDIELDWDGETYKVTPSLTLLNHLEQKPGRSLSKLFQRMMEQDLPSGAACELIADTLNYAGAEVNPDSVFEATGGGIGGEAFTMASQILIACLPTPKETGEIVAAKKKTATRKQTGAKSTA